MDRRRKSKKSSTQVLAGEDVLHTFAAGVGIPQIIRDHRSSTTDDFLAPATCLRLPRRRLENGLTIQSGVRERLQSGHLLHEATLAESGDDDVRDTPKGSRSRRAVHPALLKIYGSMPTSLSAFDQATCENQSWANKYAPSAAAEILQIGAEATILKDWLTALVVDAVDTGRDGRDTPTSRGRRSGAKAEAPKKKKRKSELDGFIVNSDESEMEEVGGTDDEMYPSGSQGSQKKSMVRSSRTQGKKSRSSPIANAVLISGPHGCGKSAAVYAVAKELGYEVFEINAATRRSGKDIVERVGDMTRNHLVQRTTNGDSPLDDLTNVSDELEKDLKSGRQGTMQSFFQPIKKKAKVQMQVPKQEPPPPPPPPPPKPAGVSQNMINAFFQPKKASKPKDAPVAPSSAHPPKEEAESNVPPTPQTDDSHGPGIAGDASSAEQTGGSTAASPASHETEAAQRKQPRKQKQSLILFEEVDVLYDEDKQFWQTVLALVAQSKRPIILTCTSEALVPLPTLPLHAIIRFQAPPVDLAADYLLLVAANEGHLLERTAVRTLYDARGRDLRASLAELNFWCQMAVGDQKGGLEWFQPRWPPGCDTDADGQTIRVVSDDTFLTGMGWFSQDYLAAGFEYLDVEEEILHEAWDSWQLDMGDWHGSLDLAPWGQCDPRCNAPAAGLEMFERFVETMSIADACSGGTFGTGYQARLDARRPPISSKMRDDYVVGHELLQADEEDTFHPLARDVAILLRSRARERLHQDIQGMAATVPALARPVERDLIAQVAALGVTSDSSVTRKDFSAAFDPISEPELSTATTSGRLELCTLDRTLALIAVDVAPYVRTIVTSDIKVAAERARLRHLMGGGRNKRMRTTRAALSALEGGTRQTTRRERYFGDALDADLVLHTGLSSWQDALAAVTPTTMVLEPVHDAVTGHEHCSPMHGVTEAVAC